jgi:hypothetical protein
MRQNEVRRKEGKLGRRSWVERRKIRQDELCRKEGR